MLSTKICAQQLTIIMQSGAYPVWSNVSLQVLLEKIAGVCLAKQMRYIQLYETDFNVRQHRRHCQINKTLTEDLSRHSIHPMVVVSVDVVRCHDRVNNVIMELVWYALIGKLGPIAVVLHCLQTMRFYQRTGLVLR
jgi:hypothetical protein